MARVHCAPFPSFCDLFQIVGTAFLLFSIFHSGCLFLYRECCWKAANERRQTTRGSQEGNLASLAASLRACSTPPSSRSIRAASLSIVARPAGHTRSPSVRCAVSPRLASLSSLCDRPPRPSLSHPLARRAQAQADVGRGAEQEGGAEPSRAEPSQASSAAERPVDRGWAHAAKRATVDCTHSTIR